jgi:hypothetical protein
LAHSRAAETDGRAQVLLLQRTWRVPAQHDRERVLGHQKRLQKASSDDYDNRGAACDIAELFSWEVNKKRFVGYYKNYLRSLRRYAELEEFE